MGKENNDVNSLNNNQKSLYEVFNYSSLYSERSVLTMMSRSMKEERRRERDDIWRKMRMGKTAIKGLRFGGQERKLEKQKAKGVEREKE